MPVRPSFHILAALAAATALSSAAIHMLAPALPMLSGDLQVTPQGAQYTILFYLVGLAGGQLLAGALSDSVGRRPVTMGGLLLYTTAAIVAARTDSLLALTLARLVQATGGGAALVGARVIIGDLSDRSSAGRDQARLMGIVLVSTALSPMIGGYVSALFGWRAVLDIQGLLALAAFAALWRSLPETLSGQVSVGRVVGPQYTRILANRDFQGTAFAIALGSSALYMFLAISPFILIDQWGESTDDVGLYLSMMAGSAIAGTLMVAPLERRSDPFRLGLAISLAGALSAGTAAFCGAEHWLALAGPGMVITFGVGISGPSGAARLLHCEKGLAGTAISLSGALQMSVGALTAALLGMWFAPNFLVLAVAMTIVSAMAWIAARGASVHTPSAPDADPRRERR